MKVTIYDKQQDDLVRDDGEVMVFANQTDAVKYLQECDYSNEAIKETFVLFNRCKPLIPEEQGGLIMPDSWNELEEIRRQLIMVKELIDAQTYQYSPSECINGFIKLTQELMSGTHYLQTKQCNSIGRKPQDQEIWCEKCNHYKRLPKNTFAPLCNCEQLDESASPEAVGDKFEFVEWIGANGWSYNYAEQVWERSDLIDPHKSTTSELYSLFKQ